MSKYHKLIIYTDGGARGNPGPAGIGAVLKDPSAGSGQAKTVATISEFIGKATNNQAEYKAVIAALKRAKQLGANVYRMVKGKTLDTIFQPNRKYIYGWNTNSLTKPNMLS